MLDISLGLMFAIYIEFIVFFFFVWLLAFGLWLLAASDIR
jgi:hypothetical protein